MHEMNSKDYGKQNDALYCKQTINMRFVLNFSAFYFALCECVFLDNSQDNCIGVIIKKNVSAPYWTEYVNITDCYSCLKTCLQKHERAETAAYGSMQCFCSHLSYSKLHLDHSNAGCPSINDIATTSQLRVYNMSGFTVRVHFEKYIEQNLEFKANFEALLYNNGTTTNDSKILKDILSTTTCNVITTQDQRETRTSCLGVFRFNLLGENQICLRTGKTSGICEYVMVLAPVSIADIVVHVKSNGALLQSMIRGTVYNLSFHLDNKQVETLSAFAQYGKIVFEFCEIHWKLWQRAVIVDGDKKLVVRASNPLNPSGVIKEKSFKYFSAIDLEDSYYLDVMTDEIEITVEAKGGVTAKLDDLNYEWSLSGNCHNGSIYLLKNKTAVPKVNAITPYYPMLGSCRIVFTPVSKSGYRYSPKIRQLFYDFNRGVLDGYAIDSPNYFLRGKQATFVVIKSKWSYGRPSYSWKVNGTVISSGSSFRHIFNETGSYTIGVFDEHLRGLTSKNITVMEILTELKIVVTSFRYFGKPVSMRAIVNCFENVVYYWNFGDGKHYNTSSNVVEHLYSKAGIYNVQVVASNDFSEIKANKTVNETELCPDGEFETSFEDGKEVKQFRSRSIHLEVSEKKLFCFKPVSINSKWTISRWIDKLNKWRDFEKQTSNRSTDSIYIPPNKLDYGKYRFNVTVTVTDFVVFYTEGFSTIINVIESPVSAIIRGGKNRYVIKNSTFFLDASPSFDPDDLNANLRFRWSLPNGKTSDMALISFNAAELNRFGDFKVKVWSGQRNKEAIQRITIINSKEIKTNMVLDCPSCDMEQLNPSKAIKIMEKRISEYCSPNKKKDLWNLYESNVKYGKPKLEEIQCTASDQTSLPYTNGTRTSKVAYEFHWCDHANAYVRQRTRRDQTFTLRESQLLFKRKEPHSELLHIKKNYFPGNRSFIIRRVAKRSSDRVIVAERSFYVQDKPKDYSCAIHPTDKGVELLQDFEIKCNVDKNAHLLYKVLFKRVKADGISTILNIFFQRKVPQFKFHLPSGYQDKNYLIISIESENGVTREYCSIDMIVKPLVAGFNAIKSVEEYLYNRSVAVNQWFSGHPYAYHGQTLYNITLISDVLNRQPTAANFTLLHLRTQVREMLISILKRVIVSSEYVARQFASSLESCTRVTEELTNSSAVAVVEMLYNLMRRERHGNELSSELDDNFQENILTVANCIKAKINNKEDELKLLESVNYLLEDSMTKKFVRTPLEIINFTQNTFKASVTKFSPYCDESIVFNWGETRVMMKTTGDQDSKKQYDCDLFGCGLQGVTMEIDPFRDNDTYQTVSSLTKLKTQNCKQMRNCGEKITEVKMVFPIRFKNSTLQSAIYRLSSDESHIFTLERNVDTVLNMELVPIGSLSKKLNLRVGIRCAEMKYRVSSDMSFFTRVEPLQQYFSPKNFSKKCEILNVVVDIQWEVEPTKYESQQTEVLYNLHMRSLDCLTKKPDNEQWSENSCKCEIYHSHAVRLLDCSCPKLKGSDYSYVVVAKTLQSSLKEIVLDRERNRIVTTVMLVLLSCYAVVAVVLFVKERRQFKNSTPIPLERCDPSHTHKYKITVYTGHCCGADTTAKVAVVLYGENNSSYPVELFTKSHALFQRNSRDVFVVSVRENLGSLNCIHLWHDNSGSSPSWFVDKLIIKDLSTHEKWMFKCSRWLAVDKNDGMLDCKIKPSNPKRKFTFKEFQLALGKNLMDFHIWLSLIRMPMFSLFTRAERLTCCMALLFGYLYFNAYFCYHYKEFIVDCVSVFNPTMSQFKAGVYATLTCLPIYFFFAVMFRYTKSFIWLQPAKSGKVAPASVTQPTLHEPCAVEECEKVVPKIGHSSEDVRRRKQLELAALLVKSMGDEDDPVSDEEIMYSDEDSSTEMTGIAPTIHSPVIVSQNRKNIEHELASNSSRSSLLLARPTSLRFPMCFNVLMWIGCIVTFFLSFQFTVEYVSRLDDVTVRCYKQSVFWSIFISVFISQPFQALFVTVFQVLHGFCYSTIIDEPAQEIEEDVVPDDSMFASFTEKNFEDPLYRKLFCIKYLKPLSKRAITRARYKLQKQNNTVIVFRDVLMYCLLLVFLYLLNPFWEQKSIFLHKEGLKTFFNRQVNTSSLLAWWSSSPQTFLDTLTFDNKTLTMKAFQNKDLLIGNPEVRMVFKYCQVNNTYNGTVANATKRDCSKKVEEKVLEFGESQKENWLGLSCSIYENLNEHVTDISLKYVIFTPPLAVFSVVKMSSHIIAPSARVQSEVAITTAGFHVDRSMNLSFQTICQLLFTVVPILLLVRQVYSSIENKKRAVLGVSVELMILFLSLVSVIIMWIWIKYQYFTLVVLLQHQYEANIVNDLQTIYKYQEAFKCSIAFMLFFVSIKVCYVIGLDKLFNCQAEIFTSVISSVLFPLFALLVVFVGFAHMGVLLFGDHLKMYETFVQAFSRIVIFLRKTGAENLMAYSSHQQMLLALYVIAFCICMIVFFNLVKAAFCQSRINYLLSVKRKRIPIKESFFKKIRGIFSLIRSYLEEPKDEDDTLKRVPMSYIFKELDEQLNDLEFRLTHLTCKANMPAKALTDRGSSSNCTNVEYVYKGDNERPSYSSLHRDLSSSKSSHFEFPTEENIAEPNVECTSKKSSESGSMTTHAETVISNPTKRRLPFQRTMRAFPTPMNETLKSSEYSHVLLDPWLGVNDCAKTERIAMVYLKHQTTTDEEISLVACKDEENVAIGEVSVDASTGAKEPKSNCFKKNRGGLKRPQVVVNDFTNNVWEGDVEDFYGYSKRSNVRLNAFEDEPSPIASDNEDCSPSILKPFQLSVDISVEKQCEAERIVYESGSK